MLYYGIALSLLLHAIFFVVANGISAPHSKSINYQKIVLVQEKIMGKHLEAQRSQEKETPKLPIKKRKALIAQKVQKIQKVQQENLSEPTDFPLSKREENISARDAHEQGPPNDINTSEAESPSHTASSSLLEEEVVRPSGNMEEQMLINGNSLPCAQLKIPPKFLGQGLFPRKYTINMALEETNLAVAVKRVSAEAEAAPFLDNFIAKEFMKCVVEKNKEMAEYYFAKKFQGEFAVSYNFFE